MHVDVREESAATLGEYARISIAFEVREILEVDPAGLDGIRLQPRLVAQPWVKDYDALRGESPARWARRWNTSNWGFLAAYSDDERVAGAVVAFDTPGTNMLRGRRDLACLWDLRVAPTHRNKGIGTSLFHAAEGWAAHRGVHEMVIETQNINVPASRFYARMGCTLGTIDRHAYPDLPNEVQLLWWKRLSPA